MVEWREQNSSTTQTVNTSDPKKTERGKVRSQTSLKFLVIHSRSPSPENGPDSSSRLTLLHPRILSGRGLPRPGTGLFREIIFVGPGSRHLASDSLLFNFKQRSQILKDFSPSEVLAFNNSHVRRQKKTLANRQLTRHQLTLSCGRSAGNVG